MTALALDIPRRPATPFVSKSPQAAGNEGKCMEQIISLINKSLNASQEWKSIAEQAIEPDIDEFVTNLEFVSPPPKNVYTVKARFHFVGRGKPVKRDLSELTDYFNEDYED